MNTPDNEWWVAQAGEYVLGTLEHSERLAFKKAKEHDEHAQRLVAQWEQALQPLANSLTPIPVDSHVWERISNRLFNKDANPTNIISIDKHRSTTKALNNSLDRWRSYAGLATVASMLMGSLFWINYQKTRDVIPIESIVSVSQLDAISVVRDAGSNPLWVVDAALRDGFIRVTAVAPPAIDNSQSYELWAVKPDNAGVQSMGLIPDEVDQSIVVKIDTMDEAPAAFAVSLEPQGGSVEAGPTGPVLYQGEYRELQQ